jgi:hypothetical protein
MSFGEHWNRDVGAIFAEAGGLGDDVGMDLNDVDDIGVPVLAPNNKEVRSDAIRQDLRKAGLQNLDQTRAMGSLRQLAQDSGANVNTTMLFTILGLGLLGLLLFLNTGSPGMGDIGKKLSVRSRHRWTPRTSKKRRAQWKQKMLRRRTRKS